MLEKIVPITRLGSVGKTVSDTKFFLYNFI